MEEMAKEVLVAEVVVEVLAMNPPVKVEEAVEMKPLRKPRVVEVATPYAVVVKGKVEARVRVPPRETVVPPVKEPPVVTVIEELASWLFPIEVVATTRPVESVAK